MEKYLAIVNTVIAIALSYIALGEQISKAIKYIRNRLSHYYDAKDIGKLIIQWFEEIDNYETIQEIDGNRKIDKIEKEISFQFRRDGFDKRIIIKSTKRFRVKFLRFVGLKKSACTIEQYIKYAHIKNINFDTALDLTSSAHHRKYNKTYFPLSFYWLIINGNYMQWKEQYRKNWENTSDDVKVIYSDIEMPIKMIRMYYKI